MLILICSCPFVIPTEAINAVSMMTTIITCIGQNLLISGLQNFLIASNYGLHIPRSSVTHSSSHSLVSFSGHQVTFDSCAISVGVAYWVPTRRSQNLIYCQAIYELEHT